MLKDTYNAPCSIVAYEFTYVGTKADDAMLDMGYSQIPWQ